MSTTARLVKRAASHTIRLELDYEGLAPPVALFDDLTMIGWRPPTAAAPPADAIDWSAPDPVSGQPYTLRSWRVSGAVVEPPAGSGPDGAWNQAEASAFLTSLQGVLTRHGIVADVSGVGSALASAVRPPVASRAAAPLPPPPEPRPSASAGTSAGGFGDPPAPPAPAAPQTSGECCRVRIVIDPNARGMLVERAGAYGAEVDYHPIERTRAVRYRGTVDHQVVLAYQADLVLPREAVPSVIEGLFAEPPVVEPIAERPVESSGERGEPEMATDPVADDGDLEIAEVHQLPVEGAA